MANIMAATNAISKTEKNVSQNFMFRGIDSVMNELHTIFSKEGVFILPSVQDYTFENRTTKSGSVLTFTRVRIIFKYITTDGSFVETVNVGEAMDSGDKGFNKAMSIALKYSLLQMLLIPTAEQKDPDATAPEETDDLYIALQEVKEATTKADLASIYNRWGKHQTNSEFINALSERKKQVQ